jgi:hypothetical protein
MDSHEFNRPPSGSRRIRDKRRAIRIPLDAPVAVADYDEHRRQQVFRDVIARDISRSGLAYFSERLPASQYIVARLGTADEAITVLMQMVRYEQGYWFRRRQYLICAQFIERL